MILAKCVSLILDLVLFLMRVVLEYLWLIHVMFWQLLLNGFCVKLGNDYGWYNMWYAVDRLINIVAKFCFFVLQLKKKCFITSLQNVSYSSERRVISKCLDDSVFNVIMSHGSNKNLMIPTVKQSCIKHFISYVSSIFFRLMKDAT